MDTEAAGSWLHWLYGEGFAGRIHICGHATWRGQAFEDVHDAVRYAGILDDESAPIPLAGVYHRLTTLGEILRGRGRDEDSVLLPAVMLDLDLRGPGHKAETYPETLDDLRKVLDLAGLPEPSAWVNSGGGRYPCWKLTEPILLTSSEIAFTVGQDGLRLVQRAVREAAASLGWKLDNTSDLARVYRLPGTTNRKGGTPVTATWEMGSEETYLLSDLVGNVAQRTSQPVPDAAPVQSSLFADAVPQSSLFADHSRSYASPDSSRTFTVGQAMAFVKPFLSTLAAAEDGEINVRLNDAACALAHFGEEFWDEGAADAQLMLALESTAYDGQTWKAEDTIASARRGMASDWRAMLVEEARDATPEEVAASVVADGGEDPVEALLNEMISFEDVSEIPPPRYLIHGLLQFDSESWIIGKPGSKKSFVALDMAARVARGEKEWQGRRINPADVVMIVAEGAGGVGKRVKAWRKRFGEAAGMRVLPRPVQAAERVMGATQVHREWKVLALACERLAASARERGRGLFVIIDTQARVTVGLNENSAEDMGYYIEAIRLIRARTQACVLSVHHTGRVGGDARGSSALDGAQTTELKVESAPKTLTGRLVVDKQKDMEQIEDITLGFEVVDLGQDGDGEAVNSLVLADRGSVAFRAAWAGSEVTEADGGVPISSRVTVDPWVRGRTGVEAERWAVQVLWDAAGDVGLTGSEVRRIVAEKLGKKIPDATWYPAWQRVTNSSGATEKDRWSDVVMPASTPSKWTVDRSVDPSH